MLRIELLTRRHSRKDFDCGQAALNEFLQKTAMQHIEKGISRTFVIVDTDEPLKINGYFTLAGCEVISRNLPTGYAKKYPDRVPAAKLARLAVAREKQRQGLGMIMMTEAMKRIISIAENIGIIGMFVDAKNPTAAHYYKKFGFIALREHPLILFLPLQSFKSAKEATTI